MRSPKKASPRPQWAHLPQELLALTFNFLQNDVDFLRSGLVCTAWKSAAVNSRRRFSPLIFTPTKHHSEDNLFDITTQDSHRIRLPEPPERRLWIQCSTRGWLVAVGIAPPHQTRLLNPFSKTQITLPRIDHGFIEFADNPIKKAAISTDPTNPDCEVLVIHHSGGKLSLCRISGENWAHFSPPETSPEISYADAVFHNGKFYVTDTKGNIFECVLSGSDPKIVLVTVSVDGSFNEKFLVSSSSGELWVVVRVCGCKELYGLEEEEDFKVFRLDFGDRRWRKVDDLGSDGLYLAGKGSAAVSPSGNRVFFMDCSWCWSREVEVYDFQRKKMEKVHVDFTITSPAYWIIPQLG